MEHESIALNGTESLAYIVGLGRSRYALRFYNGDRPGWQVTRNSDFIVGDYSLALYGEEAGKLALKRLRQLQAIERAAA